MTGWRQKIKKSVSEIMGRIVYIYFLPHPQLKFGSLGVNNMILFFKKPFLMVQRSLAVTNQAKS